MSRSVVYGLVLFVVSITSTFQEDAPLRFSCQGRGAGYYADVDSGCQIYHMCDGLGRQFSYSCPNTTLFQQRMLICDHWYMVNCSRSETDYTANLLIGQQKPFVEDSEMDAHYRTPRPDLFTDPTASEINVIYRTGRAQNRTNLNLVGVNTDFDQNNGSSVVTDKPAYNVPSHWSTEYSRSTPPTVNVPQSVEADQQPVSPAVKWVSVEVPNEGRDSKTSKEIVRNQEGPILVPIPKAINFKANNLENTINGFPKEKVVNFKSYFKATTPVFPTKEELATTESPLDDILNPPSELSQNAQFNSINSELESGIAVNFKSLFRATTPVFPTKEELGTTESPVDDILNPPSELNQNAQLNSVNSELERGIAVNFKSLFNATTPVYPTKEELGTTEAPVDDILQAPSLDDRPREVVVNFQSQFKATTPVYPTKEELGTTEAPVDDILQPPLSESGKQIEPSRLFEPPVFQSRNSDQSTDERPNKSVKGKTKTSSRLINEKVLKDLRKMFSIPDYEFPLDSISRAGYDQNLDSFHANPFLADIMPRQHAFQ